MRRTVSAPSTAAASTTLSERLTKLGVVEALLHELRVAEDRLEEIVEVVRDAPGERWPRAVSFSDWCSCFSTSRWAVMSRTIAIRPSSPPWRPWSADKVTASSTGRGCPAVAVV